MMHARTYALARTRTPRRMATRPMQLNLSAGYHDCHSIRVVPVIIFAALSVSPRPSVRVVTRHAQLTHSALPSVPIAHFPVFGLHNDTSLTDDRGDGEADEGRPKVGGSGSDGSIEGVALVQWKENLLQDYLSLDPACDAVFEAWQDRR